MNYWVIREIEYDLLEQLSITTIVICQILPFIILYEKSKLPEGLWDYILRYLNNNIYLLDHTEI